MMMAPSPQHNQVLSDRESTVSNRTDLNFPVVENLQQALEQIRLVICDLLLQIVGVNVCDIIHAYFKDDFCVCNRVFKSIREVEIHTSCTFQKCVIWVPKLILFADTSFENCVLMQMPIHDPSTYCLFEIRSDCSVRSIMGGVILMNANENDFVDHVYRWIFSK
jgi:hypothetical protein